MFKFKLNFIMLGLVKKCFAVVVFCFNPDKMFFLYVVVRVIIIYLISVDLQFLWLITN
jgi:hypothetical protein